MPSTYSTLNFELIATGEQTGAWGATTDTNIGTAINEAIVGAATVTFASADVTLTFTQANTTQAARNFALTLSGTSGGARNLILGTGCQISKPYLIINNLADAVTVKNTTGTGVTVPAGTQAWVYNNATNVVSAINYIPSITLGSALSVASGGTGVQTITANGVMVGNGTSAITTVAPGTSGNVLTSNGTAWVSSTPTTYGSVTSVSGTGSANGLSLSGTVTTSGSITLSGSVTSLTTTNFTIQESGGKLIFKYGGTTIASLDSSGNFIALTNVTAYGTP